MFLQQAEVPSPTSILHFLRQLEPNTLLFCRFHTALWNETASKHLMCWCDFKCNLFTVTIMAFFHSTLWPTERFTVWSCQLAWKIGTGGSPKHHKMSLVFKRKWIIYIRWKVFSSMFLSFFCVYFALICLFSFSKCKKMLKMCNKKK